MIVDTHILISNILYKYLSKQIDFKLNRLAFAYGNIKPDFIDRDIKRPHTLKESLHCVNKYSEKLMRENISIKEFSISLGVICHYMSDYFCLYHREGNDKKGFFEHILYEFSIHLRLLTLILRGELRLNNNEMLGNSVEEIVLKLEEKYDGEEKGLTRDINYALFAATQSSRLIVYSSQLYFEENQTNVMGEYLLSKINGGNL